MLTACFPYVRPLLIATNLLKICHDYHFIDFFLVCFRNVYWYITTGLSFSLSNNPWDEPIAVCKPIRIGSPNKIITYAFSFSNISYKSHPKRVGNLYLHDSLMVERVLKPTAGPPLNVSCVPIGLKLATTPHICKRLRPMFSWDMTY